MTMMMMKPRARILVIVLGAVKFIVLNIGPKVRGFKPGGGQRISKGEKSVARLLSEGK
jgi:hypothetical protein